MYEMPMNNNFGINPYNPFQPRQQGFPGQPQMFPGQQPQNLIRVTGMDGAGFPTVRAFAFTPIEINQPAKPQGDYVTREEFEELKGMIFDGKQSVRKNSRTSPADGGTNQ